MKNIANYDAEKYIAPNYEKIEDGIYKSVKDSSEEETIYVTSLTFEQEPDLGEEESPSFISQYPLEDILDKFYVYVSDFYEDKNEHSEHTCYQEFGAPDMEDIRKLRSIIGKHVYNVTYEKDQEEYVKLVIE